MAAQLMPGVEKVSRDLQSSGYLALAVTYRLARCGRITGQDPNYEDPLSGRPPEQTDDIKSLIKAARSLTNLCNGNVGVLGGSGGASHAIFVSAEPGPAEPARGDRGREAGPRLTLVPTRARAGANLCGLPF